ncbi:MAG: sulfite exporter TauE/SafE family protein [Pseudomonadota bacterium]
MISAEIILMLFATGIVSGVINVIAGGSSLLTFPVLVASGLPPVVANATNFVAVLPGNASALPSYAPELKKNRKMAVWLVAASLAGGLVGNLFLIHTTNEFFLEIIPWLILTATLIYTFADRIRMILRARDSDGEIAPSFTHLFIVFLFSIYGGYFGAGLGVIMLAVLTLIGYSDFHEANALKNLTNTMIGALGVLIFAFSDLISWPHAIIMMAGAAIGGNIAVRFARRISQKLLANTVIVLGFCLTIYYFLN